MHYGEPHAGNCIPRGLKGYPGWRVDSLRCPSWPEADSLPQEGALRHALCGMLVLIGAREQTQEKIGRGGWMRFAKEK